MKTPARDTELSKRLTQGLSDFKTNSPSTGQQSFCEQQAGCSLQWKFNILSQTVLVGNVKGSRLAASPLFATMRDEGASYTSGENQGTHFTDGGSEGRRRIQCPDRHAYSQCPDHQAITEGDRQREVAFTGLPRSPGVQPFCWTPRSPPQSGCFLPTARAGGTVGRSHSQQVNRSWNQLPKPVPFPTPAPAHTLTKGRLNGCSS